MQRAPTLCRLSYHCREIDENSLRDKIYLCSLYTALIERKCGVPALLTTALLKAPWVIGGITAPRFIWLAAFLIFAGTMACLFRLWSVVRREERVYHDLRRQLADLQPTDGAALRDGVASSVYSAMQEVFLQRASVAPVLVSAWRRFAMQTVLRRDAAGQERLWASESAETVFNEATVVEPRVNRGFFAAIPGIVTGAGLLFTFLAILIALLDVTLENEQFRGLDTLISGLSGKFLSSIAALAGATVYLLCERRLSHRLSQGVYRLAVTIDELIPRLTPTRLLMAMQEHLAAQAVTLQQLPNELTSAVRQGVSAGMGPTLDRMAQTVESLSQRLQGAEVERAEATTGTLQELLQQLGQSLSVTLTDMSDRFSHTLSHSATQEFESIAQALGGSAQLLADMNTQFLTSQAAFTTLVEMTKQNTVEHMALGKTQVEELTAVLREMVAQMQDAAGLSVNNMAATLTAVVHDLSTQVAGMSEHMSQTVTANSGRATEATAAMMGRVDQWSAHSTQQLAQLIEKHQGHLERVQDVERTLDTTLAQFKSALGEYATVTTSLKSVSTHTAMMVTAATASMQHLQTTGDGLERVAKLVTTQADRLSQSHYQQDEAQQHLVVTMQRYQQIFQEVELTASKLLDQIEQQLRRYMTTTQEGFQQLTDTADKHFANASKHLGATVTGLDEHLQDLTDILERLGRFGGGNGRV